MPRFRADWILPVSSPPLHRHCLTIDAGRIRGLAPDAADAVDLGSVALLPGLVNAHTHLELSHLRGAVGRSSRFIDWVRELLRIRRERQGDSPSRMEAAAAAAIDEARRSGTILFGDVANSLAIVPVLDAADVSAAVFLELLGFAAHDGRERVAAARAGIEALTVRSSRVRVGLGAHAPYSVHRALFEAIRADVERTPGARSCVHVAESPEEVEFVARGTGPWRGVLDELGAWNPDWRAPGGSPVAYLDDIGFLDARVIAVHGVQCTGEDLRLLQARGVTVVSCPRSNQYVGVGSPPLEAFYAMDVDVAFGTDSLASVDTLNLFDELAEARRLAPRVPAAALLRSATYVGARALGFDDDYGSLDVGRRGDVLVVRIPQDVTDVEEYLVGGIEAADVSWLDAGA